MIIIGIDPGLTGAIAFFDTSGGTLTLSDMPVVSVKRNNKLKNEVSAAGLVDVIKTQVIGLTSHKAFIERVGAMPGQGVSSVFSFGRSLGIVEGVVASFGIATTIVPPVTWQKAVNVRGGTDGSRARAMELFPAYANLFARKKDDGRADAALIAWYGATH
jgi:crossover junction endodeoxyribonuclease RuvC